MDQITLGFEPLPKKTRKEVFLYEMSQVVPWAALVALIQPHARGAHQALGGRPPFAVETMLRIHCLLLWWNGSGKNTLAEYFSREADLGTLVNADAIASRLAQSSGQP